MPVLQQLSELSCLRHLPIDVLKIIAGYSKPGPVEGNFRARFFHDLLYASYMAYWRGGHRLFIADKSTIVVLDSRTGQRLDSWEFEYITGLEIDEEGSQLLVSSNVGLRLHIKIIDAMSGSTTSIVNLYFRTKSLAFIAYHKGVRRLFVATSGGFDIINLENSLKIGEYGFVFKPMYVHRNKETLWVIYHAPRLDSVLTTIDLQENSFIQIHLNRIVEERWYPAIDHVNREVFIAKPTCDYINVNSMDTGEFKRYIILRGKTHRHVRCLERDPESGWLYVLSQKKYVYVYE